MDGVMVVLCLLHCLQLNHYLATVKANATIYINEAHILIGIR